MAKAPSIQAAEFRALCQEQGVTLHPEILSKLRASVPYGAIQSASRLIQEEPQEKLSSGVIEINAQEAGITISALVGVINSTFEPAQPKDGALVLNVDNARRLEACAYAEVGFINTTRAAQNINRWARVFLPFQVIDNSGQIALIRKSDGVPSALSLTEVQINGIPYPAGSLMSVGTRYAKEGSHQFHKNKVEIFDAVDIVRASFLKLTAFAYPPHERRNEGFVPYYPGEKSPALYKLTLEEIKEAVTKAVDITEEREHTRMAKKIGAFSFSLSDLRSLPSNS